MFFKTYEYTQDIVLKHLSIVSGIAVAVGDEL